MKPTFTFFLILSIFFLNSCKKDNDLIRPAVANTPFLLYDLRISTDTANTDINYQSTLILKDDYTWTLDLGGAKSNGTYSWTPTTNQQALVKFTITQWTPLSTDIALSNKLKAVLEIVDNCGFSLSNPSFLNFLNNTATTTLRTNKK